MSVLSPHQKAKLVEKKQPVEKALTHHEPLDEQRGQVCRLLRLPGCKKFKRPWMSASRLAEKKLFLNDFLKIAFDGQGFCPKVYLNSRIIFLMIRPVPRWQNQAPFYRFQKALISRFHEVLISLPDLFPGIPWRPQKSSVTANYSPVPTW